jgi:hypothetical protein
LFHSNIEDEKDREEELIQRMFQYRPPTELRKKEVEVPPENKEEVTNKEKEDKLFSDQFSESRTQLAQRIDVILSGITRTGVRAVQLGTEEVIEVFYQLFNPGEAEKPLVVK